MRGDGFGGGVGGGGGDIQPRLNTVERRRRGRSELNI